MVSSFLIRQTLLALFDDKADGWPPWARNLDCHPGVDRFRRGELTDPTERSCAAQRVAMSLLARVEGVLTDEVPDFDSAEKPLDRYVGQGRHLLEFHVAKAFADRIDR